MSLDSRTCYRALKARDARFDGRFFVGVSSTRIYCRPVCTVKPPKRENCSFYPSAAAAEAGGYRPCLRCRPELAPGNASVDATTRLAQAAASMMEDRALDNEGLDTLAASLGITDRHLRRAFGTEFGVSPVEFAQTQRLLLAKRLLTDTALPVTEVAFASGFGSVRRFNALFQQRYRLRPSELRGERQGRAATAAAGDVLNF
jgi:AraC family transcriptional regulator of adaptative response / DNA-3-methyladenine glycosylase II